MLKRRMSDVTKKGGSKHLKRNPAPRFWPIHRKEHIWTIKPKTGPHSLPHCLPLTIIVRDILNLAKSGKEARTIISEGRVQVNGRIRRTGTFPVGLMDILEFPDSNATYRLLPHHAGLTLHRIKGDEAGYHLRRIEKKTLISEDQIQLSFHDGTNQRLKTLDSKKITEDTYRTLDVLRFTRDGEISEHLQLQKGASAFITDGKNRGIYGTIEEIEAIPGKKKRQLLATMNAQGNRVQTILDYIFVVGNPKPTISVPGA
ncbi:MAG: 30S ribosomal protein S4e [Candidatus Bathyarchaeota archaeon]|nr:MAG: 30S ribosomal protein S4e [Candidatus Bathyarchaeota archaeon]